MKPTPAAQPSQSQRSLGEARRDEAAFSNHVATHQQPATAALPLLAIAGCPLLAEVSSGGHAVVYRAEQPLLARQVAIKALRSDAMAEPGLAQRFLREARIMARFAHPNLPQIHDVVAEHGGLFIILEWCPGIDVLDALAAASYFPWQAAVAVALQAARALAHIHSRNIVHGDIKPANLILTRRGIVKLIDFGLAVLPEDGIASHGRPPHLATPGYESPAVEHDIHRHTDANTDQFAFGVVLHQMLYGGKPSAAFRPSVGLRLPTLVPQLVTRCLSPDPSQRFAHMADIVKQCEQLLRSDGNHDECELVRELVALLAQPSA